MHTDVTGITESPTSSRKMDVANTRNISLGIGLLDNHDLCFAPDLP
jgi:hypothetical protein